MIYCYTPAQIPQIPHWAIIEADSVYVPGDERSRSCPGHGYPAETVRYTKYIAFLSEDPWKTEVTRRIHWDNSNSFVAMYVVPAKVSTNISVNVDLPPIQTLKLS